jgi:hypothetical protein
MRTREYALGVALIVLASACALMPGPVTTPAPPTATAEVPTRVPQAGLAFSTRGWKTDFARTAIPLSEIQSAGPPRDGIPPIDDPKFVSPSEAAAWLKNQEPVIVFELNSDARAYPLQILIWHEIANDVVASVPVVITFCPLCNTAIAFDRRLDSHVLRFGTTGNLRDSDLVMWSNDPGETWWQQITGEALVGDLVGQRLTMLPAAIASFADFMSAYPQGHVLSRDTGRPGRYGSNPYVGYDDVNSSPFLYSAPKDGRLPPMERVATVELNGETAAFPFSRLAGTSAVDDVVGGTPLVVFHRDGTVSALDGGVISASRDVGAATVFSRVLDGETLTFTVRGDEFVDEQTGSSWDILGRAMAGQLAANACRP